MIETTVVGAVLKPLATRATSRAYAAIAGGEVERVLVSALDRAADLTAAELVGGCAPSSELADALREQIRTGAIRVTEDRTGAGISDLYQ